MADHSAQEVDIKTIGDAQLLYKRGVKQLWWQKKIYGTELDASKFELISAYFSGRILDVGLGMGNSTTMILKQEAVTELISYENKQDIIDLWNFEHPDPDERHTKVCEDAHLHKPSGDFVVIFYELECYTDKQKDDAEAYIGWALEHLTEGGYVILPYNRHTAAVAQRVVAQWTETITSCCTDCLSPRATWIQLTPK